MTHETGNIASGEEDWGTFHCVPFQNITSLYLFILVLRCSEGFSLVAEGGGYSVVACVGFSLQGLLLLGSRGCRACQLQQLWLRSSAVVAPGLWSTSSGLVSHQLTCSKACGICPVQGSDPCLLNSQVDSLPLHPTCEVPILFLLVQFWEKNYHAACIIDSINTWILKTTQKDKWSQKVPMTVLD